MRICGKFAVSNRQSKMLAPRICVLVVLIGVYILFVDGDIDNLGDKTRLTIRIPFANDTPPDCNNASRSQDCFGSSVASSMYFFKCVRVWNWFQYETILCRDILNHTECANSTACIA